MTLRKKLSNLLNLTFNAFGYCLGLVDVEVLVGMKEMIVRDNPIVISEVSNNQTEIINLFRSLGYKMSVFDHKEHTITPCGKDFVVSGKKDFLFIPS